MTDTKFHVRVKSLLPQGLSDPEFLSFHCSLVGTCWERADLLTRLYVIFWCVYVTFPCDFLAEVWFLIVSISDLCFLTYFYGDLWYNLKKIPRSNIFSAQFIKIISNYKKIAFHINVLQQTACLVVNPSRLAPLLSSLIARRRADFSFYDGSNIKTYLYMRWLGPDALAVVGLTELNCWICFAPVFSFMYS